jgi:N-acetylglucosaminyldiphosphoundecaprenol N-acetyl-beta-D-mannosaminyltransferase
MNIYLDNISAEEALDYIDDWIDSRKIGNIITPNCDHIVQIEKNPELKPVWDGAELLLADGHPLLWFAKWYKTPLKEKINGSSFTPELCRRAAEKGYSVFLLGAAPGVAQAAAENLKKTYPGIRIAGTFSPPYGFEKDPEEVEKINTMLRESNADILILGLGSPKQEIYSYNNMQQYQIPVTINAGATIDFLAGNKKRAPKWMVDNGLEWLYRTLQEPKRVGKRVLTDLNIFPMAWKYKQKTKRGQ